MKKEIETLYTFSYMAIGSMMPLVGQYLDMIGMDGSQIGTITATGTFVAVFAIALWGRVYNSIHAKALTIGGICMGAICLNFMLESCEEFILIMLFYCGMYFFQAPVTSLVDSFTVMEAAGSFGEKRAWGAVGFAAGVFIAGKLCELIGLNIIFDIYRISYAITIASLIVLQCRYKRCRNTATHEKKTVKKEKYADLLKSRRLVKFLICVFFFGGTNIANNTYFSFLYIEAGGTIGGVGVCMLLMVGSEMPFMAFSHRLARRFTSEKIVFAAMCISAVRFLTYGAGMPWWLIIITFFSQGAVNGIILVEFVKLAAKYAPEGCSSLAISVYYIVSGSISTIVCQYLGGVILEYSSAACVYLFMSLLNMAGVILFVFFGFMRLKK